MATRGKERGKAHPRQRPGRRNERESKEPVRGAAGAGREPDDPREEEGWTQPESSAQKGATPDEG